MLHRVYGINFNVYSTWVLQLLDKNGKLKDQREIHNIVTTQGKNFLLDVQFGGVTALSPWYVILWSGDHVPAIGDTYAVPGYTEINTEYNEATRPIYVESAASSGIISNAASRAVFTFTASAAITGLALVGGSSAKGNTAEATGILFCSARLGVLISPSAGDIINVLGTITAV